MKRAARRLLGDERWLQIALLLFMVLYYGVVLSDAGFSPAASSLNLTFNSMLHHLVHGQFDVDSQIVGEEGFLRNGHVYAYWGIWCALIRFPLLLVCRMNLDVTTWSCVFAVCLAGMIKVRTVLLVRRHCVPRPGTEYAFALMLVYVVLGGSAVGYLRSSLFQEVIFWAAAFGAIFVYFAVKGVVTGSFTGKTLFWMAFAAGLGLLTRVSTGIGLCAAFTLLLLVLLVEEKDLRALVSRRIAIPVATLLALIAAVGIVNYFRWGHPTTFANFDCYLINRIYPDRLPRLHQYGYFNPVRLPFGAMYYFLPVWMLHGPHGQLLFEGFSAKWMDVVELPPGSFFLTDLLAIGFIAMLVQALRRQRAECLAPRSRWLAVAAGLAVPCLLMMSSMSMNYRYRMEFYPEIDLLAFLGLYVVASDSEILAQFHRVRRWMTTALVVSIAAAFVWMILYKLSDWGPAQVYLQRGIAHYYLWDVWH